MIRNRDIIFGLASTSCLRDTAVAYIRSRTSRKFENMAELNISDSMIDITSHGFYQVSPLPSEEYLEAFYSEKYFQGSHGVYKNQYSITEKAQMDRESKLRIYLANRVNLNSPIVTFLDVGCGEGFFMDFLQRTGAEVLGVDFTDFGIQNHNPHLSDKILQGPILGSLKQLHSSHKTFDLIYLGNVLEHVRNPFEILEQIKPLLNKKGLLMIRVPNDFSYLQKKLVGSAIVKKNYWVAIPDHINYFTLESLTKLTESLGFSAEETIASFPIDWYLANRKSNYISKPDIGHFAYQATSFIEEAISENNDISKVFDFYASLAKIGQGRNITSVFSTA